jgi:hypothetical protein
LKGNKAHGRTGRSTAGNGRECYGLVGGATPWSRSLAGGGTDVEVPGNGGSREVPQAARATGSMDHRLRRFAQTGVPGCNGRDAGNGANGRRKSLAFASGVPPLPAMRIGKENQAKPLGFREGNLPRSGSEAVTVRGDAVTSFVPGRCGGSVQTTPPEHLPRNSVPSTYRADRS